MKKVLIAMSGGVDSCVCALLIKEEYPSCAGGTMYLYNKGSKSICGTSQDIIDAKAVCDKIGIEHNVFDFEADFENTVIKKFIEEYEAGSTPNPCIYCNRYLKFEKLLEKAKELGFDYIATGHYARISFENGRYLLKKAIDETKDQSYVLYSLSQNQLSHTLFPLGDFTKAQIRKMAQESNLSTANKSDSQDICFIPSGDYARFIEDFTGKTYPPGDFYDLKGNILGKHSGFIRYTTGQRRGLGISAPTPLYVHHKDIKNNRVYVSSDINLFTRELFADNVNLIDCDDISESRRVHAKIRYRHSPAPAVCIIENGILKVVFDEPQRAITKGQAVVLYDGDTVVGGGTIL